MPLIDGPYTTINSIPLVEQSSTPTTPASGKTTVFVKSDGLYVVDDAGTVTGPMAASAGPAYDPTGWVAAGETWTYNSADAPTFVFDVNADVTGKYSPGMRIKLTQTSIKYFIVTAVGSYAGGKTPITVYGGTDYTLANAAITSPYYSAVKAPFGFPLNPLKWTVSFADGAQSLQGTPTQNAWYNIGSYSLTVPIGAWVIWYKTSLYATSSSVAPHAETTLSTANNSESDTDFNCARWLGSFVDYSGNMFAQKAILAAAKTVYYLLARSRSTSATYIGFNAGTQSSTTITAVCAYL